MSTFTDETSALGDLKNQVKIPCYLPAMLGVLISFGAYLIAKDTGGHELWLPVSLFFGIILTTLFFWSENEGQMLIEGDDPCFSSEATEKIKPDLTLWLRMQRVYLVSASTIFGILSLIGNPVFAMYLDWKGSFLNP